MHGRRETGDHGQGGVRVGLGPTDMPERLEQLEAAVARYVRDVDPQHKLKWMETFRVKAGRNGDWY